MTNLIINKEAFTYLVNQRGEFAHLASDVSRWYDAFYNEVQKTINQIGFRPYHVLDIGSGLGVVDGLMAKFYGSVCTLIDSEEGDGVAKKYDQPFCNRVVVEQFMRDNGVPRNKWRYCDPMHIHELVPHVYDLVISLRSWCFHYPPEMYMQFVREHAAPGARIMLDVRKDRRDWRDMLATIWHEAYTVEEGQKYDRVVYIVRGRAQ